MGILDVLGKALDIVREKPSIILPYFVISFIGSITLSIIFMPLLATQPIALQTSQSPSSTLALFSTAVALTVASSLPGILIGLVFLVFITPFFNSVYSFIANGYLDGKAPDFGEAVGSARPIYSKIVITSLFANLIFLPFILISAALIVWHASYGASFLVLLIFLMLLLAALILCLFPLYPVLILEDLGPAETIKKSISIGLSNIWTIIKLFVGIGIVNAIVSSLVGVITIPILAGTSIIPNVPNSQVATSLSTALIGTWVTMVPLVFYRSYVKKSKTLDKTMMSFSKS